MHKAFIALKVALFDFFCNHFKKPSFRCRGEVILLQLKHIKITSIFDLIVYVLLIPVT